MLMLTLLMMNQVPVSKTKCTTLLPTFLLHEGRTLLATPVGVAKHYVQQATSERKRSSGSNSRPAKIRASSSMSPVEGSGSIASNATTPSPGPSSALALSLSPTSASSGTLAPSTSNATISFLFWFYAPVNLAPYPPHVGGASYQAQRHIILAAGSAASAALRSPSNTPDADWGDIGKKLTDEAFLAEFSLDLIEVYMQICHTRQPVLDPIDFRARFKLSLPTHLQPLDTPTNLTSSEPLPFSLLAVVLAWGSKFSEHPLLLLDRERNKSRSRISRMLVNKALEVAEVEKVYRLPSKEGIITCMIIEGIQSHAKSDPDRYSKFWVDNAIRLMLDLQINRQPEGQGTLIFCWWIACLSDAIGAAYLRRKPILDDDDYDTRDLAATSQFGSPADPVLPPGVQAAMCRWLWIPASEADGIPYDNLVGLVNMFSQWREEHLDRVGVPSNFEADWDFVAAVTACVYSFCLAVLRLSANLGSPLRKAVDEYGIKEYNDITRSAPDASADLSEFEALRNNIADEAQHGALRIAGLAGVLTTNGYLRLDPNSLHYALYAAGHLLARVASPEVQNCIAGLKQYGEPKNLMLPDDAAAQSVQAFGTAALLRGLAYEDAFDQAAELEQIYANAISTGQAQQTPQHSPVTTTGQTLHFSGTPGQAQAIMMTFSPQQSFGNPGFSAQSQMPSFGQTFPHDLFQQ
ncbi:hypothetical protein FRB99_001063 [Tulasnella sp. 403]|nr:hypothetical protein FRB99_001063 [Tulasnella sp. 403]